MENNLNEYDNRPGGSGGGNGSGGNGGNGNGGSGNGGGGNGPQKRQSFLFVLLSSLALVLMISWFMRTMNSASNEEIPYSSFIEMLENGEVESVVIYDGQLSITPKSDEQDGYAAQRVYYTGAAEDADRLTERLTEAGVKFSREIPDNSGWFWSLLLTYGLPILILCIGLNFLWKRMSSGGGPMGIGKSNAKLYDVQKETGITFKDVAGEDEAKESLVEVVDFLHNPAKYSKIGARLPKGALLVGPPGTGKTLLAKAVAGEAHVPFFSLAGSDFIELYVGVGASRVRKLFEEAEKHAPCIVFIDEIDAIGRSRDSKYGGGNEEREQTLNQLLSEMDGFDGKKGIIILAATNRPEILDKALLRPGRFDRRIIVDKPDLKGRVDILRVHAKDVLMDDSVDLEEIALATSGAVGSDLANMINEAAINAVKEGREFVAQKDLFNAVEVVLVGKEKKDRIMSKEERRIVSYHETGHALIAALQKNSEPVQKITIVPRTMGALGYVMQVPEEEKYLNTQAELHDMLVGLLGGRAAEEIVFDTVTTGASNDIEKATNIARAMVTQYGMSKRFGLMGLETVESKYLDGRTAMNCSDVTAAAVDEEVMKILKESYKEAKKMLKENRALMDKLAEHLIEKETITGKEFMKIFREEKGLPEPEEKPKEKDRAALENTDPAKQAGVLPQNPPGQGSAWNAGTQAGQPEQGMTGQAGASAQMPLGQGGAWQNTGMQNAVTGADAGDAAGAQQNADVPAGTAVSGNMPEYEREQLLRNAWPQIKGLQEQDGTGIQDGASGMNAGNAPQSADEQNAADDEREISPKVENEFAEALRNRQYARKEDQNGNNGEQSGRK
ncbi:MAG: ATP-dependent zinc metalloprotease FtsH [bacterium]|nr:ATP-dependent zinc metalloprotease FtsH [bacterium]